MKQFPSAIVPSRSLELRGAIVALRDALREAWSTSSDYEANLTNSLGEPDFFERRLLHEIHGLYVQVSFLLEALELQSLLADFKEDFAKFRHASSVELGFDEMDNPYPLALDQLATYASPLLSAVLPSEPEDELPRLERILQGTARLVKDRGITPSNEAEVRTALYGHLIHVFPKTVREVPIAKVSKCYKPDIGIPELKAAVEFKFCDSETELKKAIGGIFEDVAGYAGSADWQFFYAVLYVTDAFMTQAQIEAEFQLSLVDRSWKPLLIQGKGARRPRSRTSRPGQVRARSKK